MILLCSFLMLFALSFYAIDIHTELQRLCHNIFHVILLSVIFINHLEAISLSALT